MTDTLTLNKVRDQEGVFFILMFAVMAVAAALASLVQLPGIVGAFLVGLAITAAASKHSIQPGIASLMSLPGSVLALNAVFHERFAQCGARSSVERRLD